MPIDPAMLAKSLGTLNDLDPTRDLAATLQQAVIAAKQLFDADAAGIMLADADGNLHWASASTRAPRSLRTTRKCSRLVPARRRLPAAGQRSCTTPPWSSGGARSP
jgi:hypothetical protein